MWETADLLAQPIFKTSIHFVILLFFFFLANQRCIRPQLDWREEQEINRSMCSRCACYACSLYADVSIGPSRTRADDDIYVTRAKVFPNGHVNA